MKRRTRRKLTFTERITTVGKTSYFLREDVRAYRHQEDEIRLRRGVWNYVEAIVSLRDQPAKVRSFFQNVLDRLLAGQEVAVAELVANADMTTEESRSFQTMFDEIARQGFLYSSDEAILAKTIASLLGGKTTWMEKISTVSAPVLFVTDTQSARDMALATAEKIGLPLRALDASVIDALSKADLTTRTDAVEYETTFEKFRPHFLEYSCIAGVFLSPNISFLRNLNRLLVTLEKPLVLGLVDGPFASVSATVAQQSGCFECYEHRLLARLEDMSVYYRFVKETAAQPGRDQPGNAFSPISNILTSGVLAEAALFASVGLSRLAGRVVSVYLPLLEIQVQDLLRVPYCPACGHVSQNQMSEMYIASQAVMNRMIERIDLQAE
jgi:thiazole/oxazole-forming peptide maturase SagC family component